MLLSYSFKLTIIFVILLTTSSQAIFFHLSKNGIFDLFKIFREKKEIKKPISNIHHLHLYYHPFHVQSYSSPLNTITAPTEPELDKIYLNQLESLGWSNSKINHIPESSNYHAPIKNTWLTLTTYPNHPENTVDKNNLDHHTESQYDNEILIHNPRKHEITQPKLMVYNQKDSNTLMAFFEKLELIKNVIFQPV